MNEGRGTGRLNGQQLENPESGARLLQANISRERYATISSTRHLSGNRCNQNCGSGIELLEPEMGERDRSIHYF